MRTLVFVHSLMAVALPWMLVALLAGLISGCQIQELQPTPEVAFEEQSKDSAIRKAYGGRTFFDVRKNEGSATNVSQNITGSAARVVFQKDMLVAERRIEGDQIYLKIITKEKNLTSNPPVENLYVDEGYVSIRSAKNEVCSSLEPKTDRTLRHSKRTIISNASRFSGQKVQPTLLISQVKKIEDVIEPLAETEGLSPCVQCSQDRGALGQFSISHANLKVTPKNGNLPPGILGTRCATASACNFPYTIINYDEFISGPNFPRKRYNCELIISPTVPYLSSLLSKCLRFIVRIDGQDVPVESCSQVADFAAGDAP